MREHVSMAIDYQREKHENRSLERLVENERETQANDLE